MRTLPSEFTADASEGKQHDYRFAIIDGESGERRFFGYKKPAGEERFEPHGLRGYSIEEQVRSVELFLDYSPAGSKLYERDGRGLRYVAIGERV